MLASDFRACESETLYKPVLRKYDGIVFFQNVILYEINEIEITFILMKNGKLGKLK